MTPTEAAASLLAQLGKPAPKDVLSLPGGRNNRVWRVECGTEAFLLKSYFWSESDPRDRLGQEWAFLEFLRSIGSGKAPEPIAKNAPSRFALLEFIVGDPPQEITESDILDAVRFFAEMNSQREFAKNLPPVSEACFSMQEHLDSVLKRVERLTQIQPDSEVHVETIGFIESAITPLWKTIKARIEKISSSDRQSILPVSERCLSPSDFGFHNALRQSDGSLRYVDFEYAGWDDPAKTLIDFTNQPDRVLPDDLATLFLKKTSSLFPNPESLHKRITLLTPLYQLKWACICLNAFFPNRLSDPAHPLPLQLSRANVMASRAINEIAKTPH